MLSRIAESLYWLGRYTERAESDRAHPRRVLARVARRPRGRRRVRVPPAARGDGRGRARRCRRRHQRRVARRLLRRRPALRGSIVRSLEAVWENARGRARGDLVGDVGEHQRDAQRARRRARGRSVFAQHGFLGWVRDRRRDRGGARRRDDESRRRAGASSCSAVRSNGSTDRATRCRPGWATRGGVRAGSRRCAAARRTSRTCAPIAAGVEGSKALEFLLLDRLFPRSVFHTLGAAETALFDLDPASDRHGDRQRTAPRRRPRVRGARVRPRRRARAIVARAPRPARTGVHASARRDRASASSTPRSPSGGVPDESGRLSIEHVTQLRVRGRGARLVQRGADHARPVTRRRSFSTIASTCARRSGHALRRLLGY